MVAVHHQHLHLLEVDIAQNKVLQILAEDVVQKETAATMDRDHIAGLQKTNNADNF